MTILCEAPLVDRRLVTDSGGRSERRFVIETLAQIGDRSRAIQITLTNREKMAYRMLLGRQAIGKFGSLLIRQSQLCWQKHTPTQARNLYKKTTTGHTA